MVIPDTVTKIDNCVFYGCSDLKTIELPDGLTTIGEYAFYGTGLTDIAHTPKLKEIGAYAYAGCKGLTEITIGDSVKTIGAHAFGGCTNLKKVTLNEGLESIGAYAFRNTKIQSITVPSTIKSLQSRESYDYRSFACEAPDLKTVIFADGIRTIPEYALRDCTIVTNVVIPDSVTRIDGYAFAGCTGLQNVYYGSDKAQRDKISIAGNNDPFLAAQWFYSYVPATYQVIYYVDGAVYRQYSVQQFSAVPVPDDPVRPGYTFIGWTPEIPAIVENSDLQFSAQWETGVLATGTCGAQGDNLTWMLTGDGVLTIRGSGDMRDYFGGNEGDDSEWSDDQKEIIHTIIIENGVTSIGQFAFVSCYHLTSVSIPDTVQKIKYGAFLDCIRLKSIYIPSGVSKLGSFVRLPGNDDFYQSDYSAANSVFSDTYALEEINVDPQNEVYCSVNGVLFTKDRQTLLCYPQGKKDSSYTIPDTVKQISSEAFRYSVNLKEVTIPDSVTNATDAFNSSGIEMLRIGRAVESLGEINSENLKNIFVSSDNSTYLDLDGVLYNKNRTELIRYPVGREDTSFEIPSGIVCVGNRTFANAVHLESVTIPLSTTEIKHEAFYQCRRLRHTFFQGTKSQWESVKIDQEDEYFEYHAKSLYENYALILSVIHFSTEQEAELMSIAVTKAPNKTTYEYGEPIDLTGMVITATYSDGATKPIDISSCSVSGYNSVNVGFQTVSVTYQRKTASFSISVVKHMEMHNTNNGLVSITPARGVAGQTVDVVISMQENPGLISTKLSIVYDPEVLTLQGVKNGDVITGGSFTTSQSLSAIPFIVLWNDSLAQENYTANGTLLTLTFKIADNAEPGTTKITLTHEESATLNRDLDIVSLIPYSGNIEITERVVGDADGDGTLTLKDVVIMRRMLAGWEGYSINDANADVDGDGKVTLKDAVLIERYLADWEVTLK